MRIPPTSSRERRLVMFDISLRALGHLVAEVLERFA
jgi:hypothetical protein